MDSEIFNKLSPTKLFFRCAIPSMITMAFGSLYQIADGLFVGRFIGEDALAAVNIVMPVIMIVFAFANMVATGASVRIAVLLGKKKQVEASKIFSFALKFIFLLSCAVGVIGFVFAEFFVWLLAPTATGKAIKYGVVYLRVYALFSPLSTLSHATDNFLRVCGKEKLSMFLGIGTQLLNVMLDVILIAFFSQGVWAAAFTSCFAMALSAVISLLLFRKKRLDLYYTRKNIPAWTFIHILANGSSEFFSNISVSIMSIAYNYFVLKYGGTTGVAAFSVIMYVDSIMGMLVFGMCDSLQPVISYCHGAGLCKKVKSIFKRVILSAVVLSVASMLFMMLAGRYIAPLFIKPQDIKLLAVSITGMELFSISYLTGWVDMCFSSYFTAIEKPVLSLLTSFFGTLVFPILFLFLLTPFFELTGVWYATIASCTTSAILTTIFALNITTSLKLQDK